MRPMTFLVVEDSPTMRQLISFSLRRFPDCRIVEAVDGADALRRMAYDEIDFVLTDINMPIMDGLKLVALLRANASTRNMPIIIITTEGAEEDRQRGLELGADAYISKPVETDALVRRVEQVLQDRWAEVGGTP
ncbi:MAG: response regulator [Acidobacteria bacterium]|nr:response regulator [Acidobacteriota bacterium]